MGNMKTKRVSWLVVLLAIVGVTLSSIPATLAGANDNALELPSPLCDSVQAPPGNKAAVRLYAQGVQIYRWNGASWVFVEPVATLYADANFHGKVGVHYGGPTWETNNGGKVVATLQEKCSPDPTAIPWLLLQAVSTEGPGVFSRVTYLQRVNTKGGLAPTAPGSSIGAVAEVPYSAEYVFYRAER